jgi:CheY-like chemotaxis protein
VSGVSSERPRVLVAHEQALIGRAVERVLDLYGFEVEWCATGLGAQTRLREAKFDAFVVDVALPDLPGFLLIDEAREQGVRAIILAAAVYRKTSYKRRPTRLYGADDYVEIHHLGDHLPQRLRHHLGMADDHLEETEVRGIHELLESIGDKRLDDPNGKRLAELLVADMLLYNADAFGLGEAPLVRERLNGQLDGLSKIFLQVHGNDNPADPKPIIAEALGHFLSNGVFAGLVDELALGASDEEGAPEMPNPRLA